MISSYESKGDLFTLKFLICLNRVWRINVYIFLFTSLSSSATSSHPNDIYIAGYSDQILRFIAERGDTGQVTHVQNIDKAYNLDDIKVRACFLLGRRRGRGMDEEMGRGWGNSHVGWDMWWFIAERGDNGQVTQVQNVIKAYNLDDAKVRDEFLLRRGWGEGREEEGNGEGLEEAVMLGKTCEDCRR